LPPPDHLLTLGRVSTGRFDSAIATKQALERPRIPDRQDARRLVREIDRILARLEELQLRGIQTLPVDLQGEVRALLGRLPEEAAGCVADVGRVQTVQDGLLDAQQPLLDLWHLQRSRQR
jgi:hypothetical protein